MLQFITEKNSTTPPVTFFFNSECLLFSSLLGFWQSFNSENPWLRRLWYKFRTIVIKKHAESTKIRTKQVDLTNLYIKTCRLVLILCIYTPTKRLLYFYIIFLSSIPNLKYLWNAQRDVRCTSTHFCRKSLLVICPYNSKYYINKRNIKIE